MTTNIVQYSFLSQPPPQKKKPTQPLPLIPGTIPAPTPSTRRRSNTFSTITSWASAVQPGSPAPRSPHRRPSVSSQRRPSLRRSSITHGQATSGSFIHLIHTPTPSNEKQFDLTSLGYTSFFLSLPYTATTPVQTKTPTASPAPKKTLKHFRSLGLLRPLRSKAVPPLPGSKPASPTRAMVTTAAKKTKYVANKSKPKNLPPTLNNELLLMQFADGGSMNSNIKRAMKEQAKQTNNYGSGKDAPVGDVFRDEQGAMWWDQEEEWEYAHLLAVDRSLTSTSPFECDDSWVKFNKENTATTALDEERRGSVATQDSELDPRYLVSADDDGDDGLAVFGSTLNPSIATKPGMSVLALPPKSKRAAKHMRKGLSDDLDAFGGKRQLLDTPPSTRQRGVTRRRPAPLKLALVSQSNVQKPYLSPVDPDMARRDFLDNSFAPDPAIPLSAPATRTERDVKRRGLVAKASILNVGRLFSRN